MLKGFLLITAVVATGASVTAQGLADVARAEEARRKSVKGQVKVYTNESLRGPDGGDAPQAPAQPAPATGATPDSSPKVPAQDAAKSPVPAAESAKGEKYWRDRLAAARDALARSQTFADALQSQINGLYTEFVNMSDPAQRALIEQKRLGALAELDRVKADIPKHTKAIADVEAEARRANVPAGWLR